MSKSDDGGPAFPVVTQGWNDPDDPSDTLLAPIKSVGGMSLRDYFAAKAMQAMLASATAGPVGAVQRAMEKARVSTPDELFARNAYQMADAMLAERAK